MTRIAISFFLTILIAALLSSLIGGLFAMAIGLISPEFVSGLFDLRTERHLSIPRYAFSIGMIWGLFIGAAVSGFCCLLSVILKLIRLRIDHQPGSISNGQPH